MMLWLARSGGQVVGRIAAIDDRLHNETHGQPITWFGFFEAANAEAAGALLATVEAHAAARRSVAVLGPANPSLNESAGLLIDCFDEDPYVLMPYNPPSYARFVEDAGYRKAKDLLAWYLDLSKPLGERVLRVGARAAARRGLVVVHGRPEAVRSRPGDPARPLSRGMGGELGVRAADRRRNSSARR